MPRRLLAIAAAAALTFTFAACDVGGDGPVTEPPQQVGTSDGGGAAPSDGGGAAPSDSGGDDDQTVAAPDVPAPDPANYAGMDEHTADGATQAFRYYIAVSMWAHQTGETELLDSLQSDDCESCNEFNQDLIKLKKHDEYWSRFLILDSATMIHESTNYDHEIGYTFTTEAHTRPSDDFDSREAFPAIEYDAVGGMTWLSDSWTVGGLKAEWGSVDE